MGRNWGIPSKPGNATMRTAKSDQPVLTMFASAVFGVIGAGVAGYSFAQAQDLLTGVFQDKSLIVAVAAAGFGAWFYVWLVRPRFAAHFQPGGNAFSDIIRFYARSALGLLVFYAFARFSPAYTGSFLSTVLLCAAGGAGAAAAFQTVIAFVPGYDQEPGA